MNRLSLIIVILIAAGVCFFAGMKFQQFADDDACLDAGGQVNRAAAPYCVK